MARKAHRKSYRDLKRGYEIISLTLKPGKFRQAAPTCAASLEVGTITDVRAQGKEVGE